MDTRAEHVRWCKGRALQLLDAGDREQAVASMISDLGKHPDTEAVGAAMAPLGLYELMRGDDQSVRRWIEGFAE